VKIAICDDDNLELEKIKNIVEEFIISKQSEYQITVTAFTNGDELLRYINKHGGFDLLILDIIMPGMNGIELATEIREKSDNCKIIFLTSSPEFAVNSYKVNAFYYLLKTSLSTELAFLLNKALDYMREESSNSVIIKEKGKLTRLQISKIKYIESINHTVNFHLHNSDIISCLSTLNEFHDILLTDKRFIKCHKSFIVNMNCVKSISNKDFILDDKTLIPISRQVFQQVKILYFDYFFKKGDVFKL
jgi:DNA-binding LytR/AlgR family response regulator